MKAVRSVGSAGRQARGREYAQTKRPLPQSKLQPAFTSPPSKRLSTLVDLSKSSIPGVLGEC